MKSSESFANSMARSFLRTVSFTLLFKIMIAHAVTGEQATTIHSSLFTVDTHIDTPIRLALPGFDIQRRHDLAVHYSSVDIPKLSQGALDGGFWAIYSPQGPMTKEGYERSYFNAVRRLSQIVRMVSENEENFDVAHSSIDIERLGQTKKHIIIMSMENAYPLGEDISRLEEFFQAGVRLLGLVHTSNNQFADSSTDKNGPLWNGLSPLGIKLVEEANRLGIILDASHAHDKTLDQLIDLSKTPIVLSHSGVKAVHDHARNIDDRLLRKLAGSGGVIHINAYGSYLKKLSVNKQRLASRRKLIDEMHFAENNNRPISFETFSETLISIDEKHPPDKASFEDYMEHFFHAVEVAGKNHVGVGADWDGGGGVIGMEDVSMIPNITSRLTNAGFSTADLAAIWSGNILRVLRAVEETSN